MINLAKGVLATAAIEGNTLTEKEAIAIVERKSELPKSQGYLKKEIENILDATNLIVLRIEQDGPSPVTHEDIKTYNRMILDGLEVDSHVVPGEYVKTDIGVSGYRGAPWQEAPYLVERLCQWLNSDTFNPPDENDRVISGILKSIVAHLYLVWIHPFGDGNGRTARLLEVRFLMEAGTPSAAAHLLSNFYNKTRSDYYRRLDEASKNGGDIRNFLLYATVGFVDELRNQLRIVKHEQWLVAWTNYVHEKFHGRESIADRRQLKLILALTGRLGFIPRSEVRRLTPELAEAYAGKTAKTLSRDINELETLGLLEKNKDGLRATNEQILSFLPRSRKGEREAQIREAQEERGALLLEEARQLSLPV
ncbi:Fic family protein [Methylocapsa sp. D3K7]|uniref:Fic family protein n=1 Tax=Methylocapsa sp. D3K7 TaxID=3041435 RepID=UPI00244F0071|nr:Fic family protein [Methylocapsa sp. D3K7]WGJ13785.1 Fic family protein [Methylocapsa sp. D3K7]